MNKKMMHVLLTATLVGVALPSFAQSSDAMQGADMSSSAPSAKSDSKADHALARSVRRALAKAQGFDVSGVFVRARSGAITLSGTVRTSDQIRQAEEVTKTVQGVTSVSNKLTLFHGGNG